MITLAQITEYVQTLCPVVSINSSGVIEFDPTATQQQKTAATTVIADWLIGVYPAPVVAASTDTDNWALVNAFIDQLVITSPISGNRFAANKSSLLDIGQLILNPVPVTNITWDESWGKFYTSTAELQAVYTEAQRQIQAYKDSIFGVPV